MEFKRYQPPQVMSLEEYNQRFKKKRSSGKERRSTKTSADTLPHVAEADIQSAILEWLAWNGFLAGRTNAGAVPTEDGGYVRLLPEGWSDITGLLAVEANGTTLGIFLAIEVKRIDGETSPAQDDFLAQVAALGGCAIVARSVEDVIQGIATYCARLDKITLS